MRNITQIIGDVARGREHASDLLRDEAEELFSAWLAGDLPQLTQGALWTAYRIKGESPNELLGFVGAVEGGLRVVTAPRGPLPVILPTYNGTRREANLLPLLALVLARVGVPVLLHGSHGGVAQAPDLALADHNPINRTSTAIILNEMGLPPCRESDAIGSWLSNHRLAYAPVDALHPGLAAVLALRHHLGVRSIPHTVVKLINPFQGPAVHCAAVTHPRYLERLLGFFAATGRQALCFRGTEGEPFANPKRRPALTACTEGQCRVWMEKDGTPMVRLPALPEDDGIAATCRFIERVLNGGLPLPLPLCDQAACLMVLSGHSPDLQGAREMLGTCLTPPSAAQGSLHG